MIDILKKLLTLLPPGDKIKLVGLFVMMLIASALEVIGIGMIPVFVSIVAQPERVFDIEQLQPVWNLFNITEAEDLLVKGAIVLICVFIVKNLYIIWYRFIEAKFVWGRYAIIGSNLFKSYMNAPYDFILNRNSSELLRNVTQEAQYLVRNVLAPSIRIAMEFILILFVFVLLLYTEPYITLVVVALLGVTGILFLKVIRNKIKEYGKGAQEDRGLMIKSVNEGLGGLKDLRVLNRENWFIKRFKDQIKRFSRSQAYREVSSRSAKPVIETVAVTGMMLIVFVLYLQGRGIETVIPILALFGAAIMRLMPSIREITTVLTNFRYYSYTIYPIYNDSHTLKKYADISMDETKSSLERIDLKKEIRFDNISYRYSEADAQAVNKLDLTIPRGNAVGIVGPSGAGKTTLVDLLLGLLTPQEGSILVDGVDIQGCMSAWQRSIGYIPQFIYISDDTIRNNIAFGIPEHEIDDNNIQQAVEAAQLTDLIDSLPKGVHTVIGERGTRLSGGQRQRIGIARALYHNPSVLIMDEATSALDNVTEKFVIEAIERMRGERTIIMIAHRLTTVQNCDTLYYMENGRIIDQGTYNELIDRNPEFKKMALVD